MALVVLKCSHSYLQQDQEDELTSLRDQLTKLREEENQLEQKVEAGKQQLEQFSKTHRDLQLQVNQVRMTKTWSDRKKNMKKVL